MSRLIASILLLTLAVSCAHHKRPEDTKQERTVAGGFANVATGFEQAKGGISHLRGTVLNDKQQGYVDATETGINLMNTGAAEMDAPCRKAIEENSKSRQWFYKSSDWLTLLGGIVFALGVSCVLFAPKEPPLIRVLGYILGGFGGLLCGTFLVVRASSPYLPYMAIAMMVLAVFLIGYMGYIKVRHWRKQKQLEYEQLATKELARKLPEDETRAVVDADKSSDLSPTTQALVKQVLADDKAKSATDQAAAASALT